MDLRRESLTAHRRDEEKVKHWGRPRAEPETMNGDRTGPVRWSGSWPWFGFVRLSADIPQGRESLKSTTSDKTAASEPSVFQQVKGFLSEAFEAPPAGGYPGRSQTFTFSHIASNVNVELRADEASSHRCGHHGQPDASVRRESRRPPGRSVCGRGRSAR